MLPSPPFGDGRCLPLPPFVDGGVSALEPPNRSRFGKDNRHHYRTRCRSRNLSQLNSGSGSVWIVDLTLRVRNPHAEREVYGKGRKLTHYLNSPLELREEERGRRV